MIQKLLVANRGEIAVRVMRTAHRLGIATVAVYSDADAGAPFVRLADEAVRLPGVTPSETYLQGSKVIEAARATGADAVHPGYGFLSENEAFARDCATAGLTFVGPSPEAIASMGSKLEAKALMSDAGVPVLPGATVTESSDLAGIAEEIGFPVLVKAAFGGGGRGMRVVESAAALRDAVEGARREAESAFGDGTVFLERFVVDPRHVEVQIIGDTHGTVVHLYERECSIQRRYQKIVEEAPSPAVSSELRSELGAAAVAAGRTLGYTGAGTVEFVLGQDGSFYFLEVNTRLQVEHPVTELVTGLDLVEQQIRVAEGAPLGPDVLDATIDGHAIEVRLYAESVTRGENGTDYLPATGTLHRFDVPGEVRVDTGVEDGSVVSPHYDPMLAKVIAHGRTRAEAARTLARSLAGAELHGVTTNRDLLVGILREREFLDGATDTGYLVRHDPVALGSGTLADSGRRHAAAAALATQAANRASALVLAELPSGWRNVGGASQHVAYTLRDSDVDVAYRFRRDGLDVRVNDEPLAVALVSATPSRVVLEADGVRRDYTVHRRDGWSFVDGPDGSVALAEVPRFADPNAVAHAGSLLAPMPGTVVRVLGDAGATVEAGQPLVVLEAMKMEHTVTAPGDGVLGEVRVAAGDQVDTGQVLAVVTDPEEGRVTAPHTANGITLDALFRRSFRIFADRVAVTSDQPGEGPWTYRELGERADRLAMGLAASGLRRGDRVAVLAETRPEWVELYAALARLGVAAVTLNVRMHPDELTHCVTKAAPQALVTSGPLAGSATAIRDRCPSVKDWYCLDPHEHFAPYPELLETGAPTPDAAAEPGDLHNVLYTSGTTGLPKGAMITQQAAAVRGLRLAQWFGLTPDDGFVGWLPLFHCGGDESLYGTLLTGGRFAALRRPDPVRILDLIERDRLSWTLLLPGVITDVLAADPGDRDLGSWRFAIGYANMMPGVVSRLTAKYGIAFCDAFGQTETSYVLAHGFSGPGETPHLRKTPTPLVEIRLVDPEGGSTDEVPVGVPGECVVRGPGLMSGYLDDPDATAAAFAGGWLHTGDVLVRNDDGTLEFVDRTKYLIKTGGENVYPAEVEHAIAGHTGVQEVCAYGVPDERWGETVKVVVVRAPGTDAVTAADVVARCRERLSSYKRPRYVEFLGADELPRSTTGKLQRHVLAERGAADDQRVN